MVESLWLNIDIDKIELEGVEGAVGCKRVLESATWSTREIFVEN